jgi:hypothetical protein
MSVSVLTCTTSRKNEQASSTQRGCQIAYCQTQSPNLGKFWRALQWKMLVYFLDIGSILRPFDKFYGHWVYFEEIWYIFLSVGKLLQE